MSHMQVPCEMSYPVFRVIGHLLPEKGVQIAHLCGGDRDLLGT
jgi:hypothetical protein